MKRIVFCLVLLFSSITKIDAQVNLVPNSGFEDSISCPCCLSDFSVQLWYSPTAGSPDYFNICNDDTTIGNNMGVPLNFWGTQLSFDGVAYSGFGNGSLTQREYIQVKLKSKLLPSVRYCTRMSLSLSEMSNCGIDKIGMNFTSEVDTMYKDSLGGGVGSELNRYPQFETPAGECIVNKNNWVTYEGSFFAQGDEEYLTIGNFHPNIENTQCILDTSSVCFSYFYIDDVWVYECVYPEDTLAHIFMQPNFTTDQTTLFYTLAGHDKGSLSIYNSIGQVVYRRELDKENYQQVIDVTSFAPGMYMWQVHNDKMVCAKGKLEVVR